VPLVWAQSLWWLAQMLDDGLLDRSDIDPLGRYRRRPKPAPPVQIAILAEDFETQTQVAALGIRVERVDELETIELHPARQLARFYSAQGAAPVSLEIVMAGRFSLISTRYSLAWARRYALHSSSENFFMERNLISRGGETLTHLRGIDGESQHLARDGTFNLINLRVNYDKAWTFR
jgi:hypothetical protein